MQSDTIVQSDTIDDALSFYTTWGLPNVSGFISHGTKKWMILKFDRINRNGIL